MAQSPIQPLDVKHLRADVDPAGFAFKTTADLPDDDGWLGQDRAVDAIRMAAEIRHSDFNAFVLGPPGSGRRRAVRQLLREAAAKQPASSDWVYVNNFEEPHKPIAISLQPGGANRFRKAMERLIEELATDMPALFESDDYQTRRRTLEQSFSSVHEEAMSALFERARERNVAILRTPMGFTVASMVEDQVMTPDQYRALGEAEQRAADEAIKKTQEELAEILQKLPEREKAHRKQVEELNQALALQSVDRAIADLLAEFAGIEAIEAHLAAVRQDLVENAEIFLMGDGESKAGAFPVATTRQYTKPQFQKYTVNVIVACDTKTDCAPIVEEELPTLGNLIGRVEYASQMGALVTNFTMIKPGALHRANGGYLVLDALQVLSEPFAWDALKRALRTGEIAIYSPGERAGMMSTTSLNPDPVPLKVRVILIGERQHYYLLSALDHEFSTLFKLAADFNDHLPLDDGNGAAYARLIAHIAHQGGARPLDASAVATMLVESTRMTGDSERLSLNTHQISDIVREADFWAAQQERDLILDGDIDKAISERERRLSRLSELTQESITRETVLIDTDGTQVGQINALSVLQIGGFAFGRPSRLTARTRLGAGKVVDIEREAELGGPLHSKGVMILQGYLASNYAPDSPMSLWASLVFEQSYGGVDGDSASAAELLALLSSLSGLPIDQSFAITGSVNQFGEIQAIGGVNEKIEGFFDICAARGLTGRQGVIIPQSNVKHLALRSRVIDACAQGKFAIYPIAEIAEGVQLLMGRTAGERGTDGNYPADSVNRLVEDKLASYALARKQFGTGSKPGNAGNGNGNGATA